MNWFSPQELVRSGVRAALAALFGSYIDRRELQAAVRSQHPVPEFDYGEACTDGDLWIDFVADLGDGFDATYTVARLLAEPTLTLDGEVTRRGQILIMGGDEVYPVAKREQYENRTVGPYRAALPWLPPEQVPHLFAVPGNHDWYDGLTAFLRQFTQERWIGAWKTRQSRSYFAARLPARWWLFGLDIQLESDIDEPQQRYFREAAAHVLPGDRVIVCTAEPSWLGASEGGRGYHNLAYFVERIIRARGAEPVLTLTGDLHHYARYEERSARAQLVTAGGGGAFLLGTHHLPQELRPVRQPWQAATSERQHYVQARTFPDPPTSRRLSSQVWRFPLLNRAFVALLGLFWVLTTWVVESASRATGAGLLASLRALDGPPWSLPGLLLRVLQTSPASSALVGLFVLGAVSFARSRGGWRCALLGLVNAGAQLLSWMLLVWALARALDHPLWVAVALFPLQSLASGVLFAAYLAAAARLLGKHLEDIFAGLGFSSHKNFLRLRFEPSGRLTLYPIGIASVAHGWRLDPGAAAGQPWFASRSYKPDLATLIEPPIVFDPDEARWEVRR